MYTEVKVTWKSFVNPSLIEHEMQKINVKKKKSEFINKRATGVILKCKNLLY